VKKSTADAARAARCSSAPVASSKGRVKEDIVSESDNERRRHPRIEAVLKVKYQMGEDLLDDYLENLGHGGFLLRTDLPFAKGQRLGFSLSFPELLEPLELSGIVRWRRERREDESASALGIELVFDDTSRHAAWSNLIDRLKAANETRLSRERAPFRVLLVEDNDFVREMFEYAISRFHAEHGHGALLELKSISSATEASSLLESESFDLAIIDHFLPGISGCELVKRIRQRPRQKRVPVLVVSVGGQDVRQEALAAGADMYLEKPVLRRSLIQTIGLLTGVAKKAEPRP
jgi:uncharacterized protein (TIGR02266 family)